ncbi:uncharacterized protein LOC133359624 isoform X1 [Lethenteron reissneri]|uniref:uncharacterized protein LOC133359624 isoform X1 n=1 Tax=Lethenteron reissneri TaxID=7753 RepID=UPI002AB7D7BC|nr:uncharacterized protein LOC133359624 isoform X1 [Lethenteron reissneri]
MLEAAMEATEEAMAEAGAREAAAMMSRRRWRRRRRSGGGAAAPVHCGKRGQGSEAHGKGAAVLGGGRPQPAAFWEADTREPIGKRLKEDEFLFIPPSRFIFHGAQVYDEDVENSATSSSSSSRSSSPSSSTSSSPSSSSPSSPSSSSPSSTSPASPQADIDEVDLSNYIFSLDEEVDGDDDDEEGSGGEGGSDDEGQERDPEHRPEDNGASGGGDDDS